MSFKKVTVLFVAFAMLLSIMAPAFAAPVPSDAIGTDYETAATRLAQFDIMIGDETGSFQGEREITRAEMAKIVVAMQALGDAAEFSRGATPFEDVSADHWASGFINVAFNAGMIKGTSATTFEPDRKVTYQEAITMIVRACGYVNLPGSWPANYISKAASIGVTSGVAVSGSVNGVRGVIAKLVNNALDAHPMKVARVDANGNPLEYEVETDKTVLTKYFSLTEKTGIPLFTSNEDPDNIDAGYVKMSVRKSDGTYEDATYKAGNVNISDYFGKEIVFYINDDATPTVMGIKEVKTSSDNIITPKKFLDSNLSAINYTNSSDENKSLTPSTASEFTVKGFIFNGKKATFDASIGAKFVDNVAGGDEVYSNLKQQDATGRIVKLDGNTIFLVVDIPSQPVVVTNVNKTGKIVSVQDMSAGQTSFDLGATDVKYTITKNGSEITIDDLAKDDVVEVLKSADNKRISFDVTSNAVTGRVEGITYSAANVKEAIRINGVSYRLNDPDNYQSSVTNGSIVKALLDKNGEIEKVSADSSVAAGNYAIVLGVEEQVNASFGSMITAPKVQLLLADGTKKVFDGIEDLRVYKTDGNLSTALINDGGAWSAVDKDNEACANDSNLASKPIVRYETGSDGKLNKVSLILSGEEVAFNNINYTEDTAKWGNYLMSPDTLIFNVHGTAAKVFRYSDLPSLAGAAGSVVKVANSTFNEVEVVYVNNMTINATASDYRVAMIVSRDQIDGSDVYTFGLNDGTQVFTLETTTDATLDPDKSFPRNIVKYKVNSSNRITEMVAMEDVDTLFDGDASTAGLLVTSLDSARGYISVSDGVYEDAITEFVGVSPIVFDISDYYPGSTVSSSSRQIRALSLGGVIEDKMYIKVFKIKIDNVDTYFIVVDRNTDTDGV